MSKSVVSVEPVLVHTTVLPLGANKSRLSKRSPPSHSGPKMTFNPACHMIKVIHLLYAPYQPPVAQHCVAFAAS